MNKPVLIIEHGSKLELRAPFIITARLMPRLVIGGAFVSIDYARTSADGRTFYQVWLDLPDGSEHEVTNLRSGCGGGSLQDGTGLLLCFLSAAAESRQYRERQGKPYNMEDQDSNENLFPPAVVDWACENSDEISSLQFEIEEGGE